MRGWQRVICIWGQSKSFFGGVMWALLITRWVKCEEHHFHRKNLKKNCVNIDKVRQYYYMVIFTSNLEKLQIFNINNVVKGTVTTVFWARVLCSLAAEDARFRMRITLGVVLIRSRVFYIRVAQCSRNGPGMRLYLLVQEKFV